MIRGNLGDCCVAFTWCHFFVIPLPCYFSIVLYFQILWLPWCDACNTLLTQRQNFENWTHHINSAIKYMIKPKFYAEQLMTIHWKKLIIITVFILSASYLHFLICNCLASDKFITKSDLLIYMMLKTIEFSFRRKAQLLNQDSRWNEDSSMFCCQHPFRKLGRRGPVVNFQVLTFDGASFMWTLSKHPIFIQ